MPPNNALPQPSDAFTAEHDLISGGTFEEISASILTNRDSRQHVAKMKALGTTDNFVKDHFGDVIFEGL